MLRGLLEPLLVRGRCGEFVAFARLAKGIRREEVAMLEKGSCGEGGTNSAVAIHKDRSDQLEQKPEGLEWRGGW